MSSGVRVTWTEHWIARLLTDEVSGVRLDQLERLELAGNDTVDGFACVVMLGIDPSGSERKVWVGRDDHLIRRIEERSKTGNQVEMRTQIVVGHEIPDSRFCEQGR